jgi:hypothetical protein
MITCWPDLALWRVWETVRLECHEFEYLKMFVMGRGRGAGGRSGGRETGTGTDRGTDSGMD